MATSLRFICYASNFTKLLSLFLPLVPLVAAMPLGRLPRHSDVLGRARPDSKRPLTAKSIKKEPNTLAKPRSPRAGVGEPGDTMLLA